MAKPRATKPRWLYGPRQFEGTLSRNGERLAVKFKVSIDREGALRIEFARILSSKKSRFLFMQDAKEISYFTLKGRCRDDDTQFEAEDVHVSKWRRTIYADRPADMRPLASALHAVLRPPGTYDGPPQMQTRLVGFECFPRLQAQCPLGSVIAAGEQEAPKTVEVSGYLAIRADDADTDPAVWRAQARSLFEHVLRILDFAAGLHLKSPIEEFNARSVNEVVVTAQTDLAGDSLPVFHFLERQKIFEIAVASYFEEGHRSKDLYLAMAWVAASAPHDEIRFTNMLTALENIIDTVLGPDEQMFLSDPDFRKFAKAIRRTILETAPPAVSSRMFGNIAALNRVSLLEKIKLVTAKWGVSVADLDWSHVEAAIAVRNRIVHTGRHANKRAKADLWNHIQTMRELVVRILLTALGYDGSYISHLGGYHLARYPP